MSTPANAELVPMLTELFFPTLTSVRRPMTAEGLMTKALPLPLLVFIPALRVPMHNPLPTTPHVPEVAPFGITQVSGAVQLLSDVHEPPAVPLTHTPAPGPADGLKQ